MDGSIGGVLSSIAGLTPRTPTLPSARTDASFTQLLDESLRAHAAQRGYELPVPGAHSELPDLETADEIWDRVQAQSQAGPGGIADALMQSLSEAADRRWEQRRDRERGSSSSLFEL